MNHFFINNDTNFRISFETFHAFITYLKTTHAIPLKKKTLFKINSQHPLLAFAYALSLDDSQAHVILTDGKLGSNSNNLNKFYDFFQEQNYISTTNLESLFETFSQQETQPTKLNLTEVKTSFWFMTSGTSGDSKFILHSMQNFLSSAHKTHKSILKNANQINWSLSLPIHHIGGFMILIRSLVFKYTVTKSNWKEPNLKDTPNTFSFVPTQVDYILKSGQGKAFHLLKDAAYTIISGGAIGAGLIEKLQSMSLHGHCIFTYGASETSSQVAACHLRSIEDIPYYIPFPNTIISQVNDRVRIQSSSSCLGIFDQEYKPTKNKEVYLNDKIQWDKIHFKILGRSDDIIISGGENISLGTITQELTRLFPANQFQVFGIEDEKWGEELVCLSDLQVPNIPTLLKEKSLLKNFEIPKYFYAFDAIKTDGIKVSRQNVQEHHLKFKQKQKSRWIAMHGFMGDPKDWMKIQENADFEIECVDLHTVLNSQENSIMYMPACQALAKQLGLANCEDESINLIGYSMGARVALGLLQLFPAKIKQIFIISSHLGDMLTNTEKRKRFHADQELLASITNNEEYEMFINHWYELPLFKGIKEHPESFNTLLESRNFQKLNSYKKTLETWSVGLMPNFTQSLKPKDVEKISLIVGGEDQKYFNYARHARDKHNIPLRTIKGHSHALLSVAPSLTLEAIISLIK